MPFSLISSIWGDFSIHLWSLSRGEIMVKRRNFRDTFVSLALCILVMLILTLKHKKMLSSNAIDNCYLLRWFNVELQVKPLKHVNIM